MIRDEIINENTSQRCKSILSKQKYLKVSTQPSKTFSAIDRLVFDLV